MLKSGISIVANVEKRRRHNQKRNFIAKIDISSKEVRETNCWLRLIKESKTSNSKIDELINECEDLISILTKIVKTSTSKIQHS